MDSNEMLPERADDGWTTAQSANYHMESLFVVKVEKGVVTEVFGAGTPEQARIVAAALRLTDGGQRDPSMGALIVKGLKTTLLLAMTALEGNKTLMALYEYDLTIVRALIARYEKYTGGEEPAKVPANLS